MRTTVEFDEDTAKAVDAARRELGIGVSAAVNMLIRRGLLMQRQAGRFRQRTARLGLTVDVLHVGAALEDLEGLGAR